MAQYLGEELGQSVVVTNVTGSGGTIAANRVKDSANDGYTILCTHVSLDMSTVTKTIDWDYSDLTMGGIFAMGLGEAIIVRGDAPWNTVQDLIDDGAANPGKYTMSATTGASTMWAPIALNKAGANLNIVDAGGASDRSKPVSADKYHKFPSDTLHFHCQFCLLRYSVYLQLPDQFLPGRRMYNPYCMHSQDLPLPSSEHPDTLRFSLVYR